MTTINDGGPAFPVSVRREESYMDEFGNGRTRTVTVHEGGMSMRDYFASWCDQPGTIEAYQLAGCPNVPKPHPAWKDEEWDTNIAAKASQWWTTLSLDEKYDTYARLRYKIADAMMKARER